MLFRSNYHILLIENMNHYIEEVDARSDGILLVWKTKAEEEMREHMDLYVDAVIRRPLGKLLVCSWLFHWRTTTNYAQGIC